jgi:diketogulonate reductase-like aldo/keto reductase
MKTFKLNNGLTIPALGTGTNTFGKEGKVFSGEIAYDKNVIPRKKNGR